MNAWGVLFHIVFLPTFWETRLSELLLYTFFIFLRLLANLPCNHSK